MVAAAFADSPATEIGLRLERARAFFYLKGGQWIQVYAPLCSTAAEGLALKVLVHLTHDLPAAAGLLLFPFGFAMARRRQSAILLVLWPLVAFPLMNVFLWSGARYTASFLPQLMAGAAVVLAGRWRKPPASGLVAALACAALVAIPVAASVPLTARARADYGPGLRTGGGDCSRSERVVDGDAGFNVIPAEGLVELDVELLDPSPAAGRDPFVEVRIDGARATIARFRPDGKARVRLTAVPSLAFLEIRVFQGASARPCPVRVRLEAGQLYRTLLGRCP
jgi:hypothetical protein